MARSEEVTIDAGGREVRITSPKKVFFDARGDTKLDLVHYYLAVGEPFLAVAEGRPALMQRFPDGASGKSFFQKRVPSGAPPWLQTTMVTTPNGTTANALVLADMAHVAWAVNLGCLGFHVWPTHWDDMGHADELRIDLDPSPGVTFEMIREAAQRTRQLLDELGVVSFPKTTGNRGVHVYVRLQRQWDSYEVARAPSRWHARWSADIRTWSPPPGGRRSGANGCSSTSTRTRPTRPSSAPGACAPARGQCVGAVPLGRARHHPSRRPHDRDRSRTPGARWRSVGRACTTIPSRSSRCSRCPRRIEPRACSMPPGRPSTRRCRTSRPGWHPAGPVARRSRAAPAAGSL